MGRGFQNQYLQVAVFWGGAELGRYCRKLSSSSGVTAGSGLFSNIRSRIWPRWDELEIVLKTKTGLVLNPNLPWDGVVTDGTSTRLLSSLKPSRLIFEIGPNTTASLRLDEISVSILVGKKPVISRSKISTLPGFIRSPGAFIAENKTEWIALSIALLASAAVTLSAHSTLKSRENDVYESIAQLPGSILLPFLSEQHLLTAPTVMQFDLDRHNYVHSVWNYYADLALILGFGKSPQASSQLLPSVAVQYDNLLKQKSQELASAEANQLGKLRSKSPEQGALSVPTVKGESLNGKTRRILDKISILNDTTQYLTKRRNVVTDEFIDDIGYKYEAKTGIDATKEAFAKISSGFLGLEGDLEMQSSQAKSLAAQAALTQINLFGKERLQFGPVACCETPVAAPLVQEGLTWRQPSFGEDARISLAELKASTWGAPVNNAPKISEPIVGHIKPSDIEQTVNSGRHQLRLCYELALRRNQATKGSMEWKWQIDSRGKIVGIDLINSSIKDDELVRCVRDKIASWHFPRPQGGSVEVRYPFEFFRDKG